MEGFSGPAQPCYKLHSAYTIAILEEASRNNIRMPNVKNLLSITLTYTYSGQGWYKMNGSMHGSPINLQ